MKRPAYPFNRHLRRARHAKRERPRPDRRRAVRIEPDSYASLSDIAERAGLTQQAISLLVHDIDRLRIRTRMDLAPSLPLVLADPIQIQQVVVNLVRNAIEAMENSDVKKLVVRSSLHGSEEVDVSICDSGCGLGGISTETIFGHFFTTKPDGLGVGLAISRSIIEAHGGHLTAKQNAERGMTFGFRLPRVAPDHSEEI